MHADFPRPHGPGINALVPIHFINEESAPASSSAAVRSPVTSRASKWRVCLATCRFHRGGPRESGRGESVHYSRQLPDGVTIPVLAQGDEHDQAVVSVNAGQAETVEPAAEDAPVEEGDDAEEATPKTDPSGVVGGLPAAALSDQ